MELVKTICTSCGAPVTVTPDTDTLKCRFCGATMTVQRSGEDIALRLTSQVGKSIQETGTQTQTSIREGTQVTRAELQRLQLNHQLSSAQMQLATIQSEIRGLQRQKANNTIKRQLGELRTQEGDLIDQIGVLQDALAPAPESDEVTDPGSQETQYWDDYEIMTTNTRGKVLGIVGVTLGSWFPIAIIFGPDSAVASSLWLSWLFLAVVWLAPIGRGRTWQLKWAVIYSLMLFSFVLAWWPIGRAGFGLYYLTQRKTPLPTDQEYMTYLETAG